MSTASEIMRLDKSAISRGIAVAVNHQQNGRQNDKRQALSAGRSNSCSHRRHSRASYGNRVPCRVARARFPRLVDFVTRVRRSSMALVGSGGRSSCGTQANTGLSL